MQLQSQKKIYVLINRLLHEKTPFVFYRKPSSDILVSLVQHDSELYTTSSYTESGFIVSPFDYRKEKSILFPLSKCDIKSIDLSQIVLHKSLTKEVIPPTEHSLPYKELVKKTRTFIEEGNANKIVLSRVLTHAFELNRSGLIFEYLLSFFKTAFVSAWFHPKVGFWMGATPEKLLYLKEDELTTMSLAGTQLFKENLAWNKKEIEEQKWVTDFIVDQLLPIVDDLNISKPETVQSGHLAHIKTIITGQLSSGFGLQHLIKSLHPTPAVCGTPRNTAKTFIIENETYNRSFYTGFLGEMNMNATTDLFVNLRCMQLTDTSAKVYVGGGITKDSKPEDEWIETVNKAMILGQFL